MKNSLILTIVFVILAGGGGFFVGQQYAGTKTAAQTASGSTAGLRAGGRSGGQGRGGGAIRGDILSADSTSITVKLADGSSKIVLMDSKTQINKAVAATKADLTAGTTVAVFGSANTDGSVLAQSIQLNPTFGGGGRAPNKAAKSADAKEILVTGSNYAFSPTAITVKKGEKTRIVFKSKEGMHDFKVDELNIQTAIVQTGEEDFVEFTPDKTGTFEFYCSVLTHRAMGMKGTITVE